MGLFNISSRLGMFGKTQKRPLKNISHVAYQLFSQHGLENWSFRFDHAKSRAGMCDYSKKVISISRRYARTASQSQIKNTLLHEIAHALVGHSHGHDAICTDIDGCVVFKHCNWALRVHPVSNNLTDMC